MTAPRATPVVVMHGPGRARGEQYGEELRALIQEASRRWLDRVGTGLRIRPQDYIRELAEGCGYRAAVCRTTPDLAEEIDGIARGADVEGRLIFAMNLLDEEWAMRPAFSGVPNLSEHCSGFAVRGDPSNGPWLGQNMDLPGWLDGLQVVLDIRTPGGPRALVPSSAGMIALNALNEHGVGVCVNTLAELPASRHGLPVACVIRSIANQATMDGAVDLLTRTEHTAGQNYIVAGPDGVADIECSAAGTTRFAGDAAWVAHTNHPLAAEADRAETLVDTSQGLSRVRLDHLRARLDAVAAGGIDAAKAMLAEAPVCRGSGADSGATFYSVLMETGPQPALHLTAGSPDGHPRFERIPVGSVADAST